MIKLSILLVLTLDRCQKNMIIPTIDEKNFCILTIPLNNCLAKTWEHDGIIDKGSSVFVHCLLTGLVAKEVLSRLPKQIQEKFFPEGTVLIVASHDLGKVEPNFQMKIYSAIRTKDFPEGENLLLNVTGTKIFHNAVSQAEFQNKNPYWANIVGRHHGYSTTCLSADAGAYGYLPWHNMRQELFNLLKEKLGNTEPEIETLIQQELISGLTCVSDWIASSNTFSDVKEDTLKDFETIEKRIKLAVDNAGFVKPKIKRNLSFKDIFSFYPNKVQESLIEVADHPGVYILEAPMGMGKTEAALFIAYLFLQSENASGIYFALPTQLTSNKIYKRMNNFLKKILDDDKHRSLLLHSNAWIFKTEMGSDADFGMSWFDNKKRGLLAPFSVGTVDQALMSVLNVKHNFVRAFGLLNKVVIIDEVHTYDTYTGTLLNFLIENLEALGCTIIILSATLTKHRKYEILNSSLLTTKDCYPLITSKKYNTQEILEKEIKLIKNDKHVAIKLTQEEECIQEAILRASEGQQVLWIENLVKDSQRVFERISKISKVKCGLIHSRFLIKYREDNEEKWTYIYGRESDCRKQCGRILIGTQVLEQSLDLDADFLISRYAPIDMLLQRLGRLWRHEDFWREMNKQMRPDKAKREAYIIVPQQELPIKKQDLGEIAYVYHPYVLSRTLETLTTIGEEIIIPSQIPRLITQTYSDRDEQNEILKKQKQELDAFISITRNLALNAKTKAGTTLPDIDTSTRYTEIDSITTLILKNLINKDSSKILIFLDGTELEIPNDTLNLSSKEIKEKTKIILKNTVKVASYHVPNIMRENLLWIKKFAFIGDNDEKTSFCILIRKENNTLLGPNGEKNKNYRLYYSDKLGYIAQKR